MWYFTRKSDRKEFLLVSGNIDFMNGVAYDGEKCSAREEEIDSFYRR